MIKALIFDFDGLILATESPEVEALQAIYAEYRQEFPLQTWIRDVVGSSVSNFDPAMHLAAVTGRTLDLPALHARALAFRLGRQAVSPAMPGVDAMIKAGKRSGLLLAVASSSKRDWVAGYLRRLGLFEYFNVIKCREDVQSVKPEPDLFLEALDALGLRVEEALAFEDSPNGVLAAKRAGLRVVAVPNPITANVEISGADLILPSLASVSLEVLLAKFNSP